jgi:hypothetical protein
MCDLALVCVSHDLLVVELVAYSYALGSCATAPANPKNFSRRKSL